MKRVRAINDLLIALYKAVLNKEIITNRIKDNSYITPIEFIEWHLKKNSKNEVPFISKKFIEYSSLSIINKIKNFDPLKFRFERERKGTQKYHKALVQITTKKVLTMALDENQKRCPKYKEIIDHPKMRSCFSQIKRERHESKKTKGESIASWSKDTDLYGYASKTLRGWINEIFDDLGLLSPRRPKKN